MKDNVQSILHVKSVYLNAYTRNEGKYTQVGMAAATRHWLNRDDQAVHRYAVRFKS